MGRIDFTNQQLAASGVPDLPLERPNQAFAQMGQQAAAADQLLQQIKQRDAAMTGAQALAEFRLQRQKRQTEMRTEAKTPDGFVDASMTDFDKSAQALIDAHDDPDVQLFLEQRLIEARDSEASDAIQWQASAMQARSEALAVDTVNKYANAVNSHPGMFQSALSDIDAMIETSGLDMVHADKLRAAAKSTLARSAVYGQIETNPGGILHELQAGKWDAYLDADAKISAVNSAQSEIKRRASEARATAAMARQEALFEIQQWSQDNTASLQATGKPVPSPYSDEQLKAILKPKRYELVKHSAEYAHQLFQSTGDMRTQTPAEMTATVEKLKPEGGAEGFADKQKIYEAALAIKKQTEDARNADPGLAARMAMPAVQSAWQAFEKSNKPADLQNALKQSQIAQDALGIPKDKQRLLPNQLVWSMAGAVKSSKPEATAEIMRSTAEAFGPYWNQAFKEMKNNLDGHLRVSATIKDKQAAAILVEGSRQPVAVLRKSVGVSDNDAGISKAVADDDRVKNLSTSLSQRAGGSATATQIAASIEVLALARMRVFGEDQHAATEGAIKSVVDDRYGFVQSGDRAVRVPKDAGDIVKIDDNLDYMKRKMPLEGVDLPRDIPGSLSQDTSTTYLNNVRQKGYWVTNDDETGAVLYAGNVPVTIKGKPVTKSWKEIEDFAPVERANPTRSVGQNRIPGVN